MLLDTTSVWGGQYLLRTFYQTGLLSGAGKENALKAPLFLKSTHSRLIHGDEFQCPWRTRAVGAIFVTVGPAHRRNLRALMGTWIRKQCFTGYVPDGQL